MSTLPNHSGGLFMLGASHHRTPIEVREKLSLSTETAERLRDELARIDGLREFTVLSTCNRIEFYGVSSHATVAARVQETFCMHQKFSAEEFGKFRQYYQGEAAIQHLLEVAAGLDSQMLGETEILGQVKEAYAGAQQRRTTGPVLNRVFQKTFQAAKYVRTHTAITEGQVSVANVAVELAHSIFGDLSRTRILLLGAGEIGEKTARAFQSRGAGTLTVASRSIERAMQLASALNATALPFEHRESHLSDFDIVVCSTSAPTTVVSAFAAAVAMKRRPSRPLFFIDLALPRDVDTAIARLENVYLYNLDDLARIAEDNRTARQAEIGKARSLLLERTGSLWKTVEPQLAPLTQPGADEDPQLRTGTPAPQA